MGTPPGYKHSQATREKLSALGMGSRNSSWKGGRIKRKGYIKIYSPAHPNCDCEGYVFEHRLILEKSLGRLLSKTEVVHHVNNTKTDNSLGNLVLLKDNAEHARIHPNKYFYR